MRYPFDRTSCAVESFSSRRNSPALIQCRGLAGKDMAAK
jgi:hypothetical protein